MICNSHSLIMPWIRCQNLYSVPRRITMKLALGEEPKDIPASYDVRIGSRKPAQKVDGGPIDRILKRFGGHVRIVRVYRASKSLTRIGEQHLYYDDIEHAIGFSRMFRVDIEENCFISDVVDALRQIDTIEQASPYYLCSVPFSEPVSILTNQEDIWSARTQIRAAEAMAYEPGDPSVITAVVDTGVAAEHPEIFGRVRSGIDTVELGSHDFANGIELIGDKSGVDIDPNDEVGHGTSCAVIIAGNGRRIPPGLSGDCGLLPIRVLGAARVVGKNEPIGIGAIPDIDSGVKSAIDLGARIINMSFGTPKASLDEGDPCPHEDIVRYGVLRGCIMVAASGNSGKEERFLPAALDGVIAVGSVDADNKPSRFTTTGDHVALCAPGERIISAGLKEYQKVTGSSFAAPFVTATAALLMSRSLRRSFCLDQATAKRLMTETAVPWPPGQTSGCGTGVLNAYAALKALDNLIDQKTYNKKVTPIEKEGL